MKLLRFSLGARFDLLKDRVEPSDIDRIFNELTELFCAEEVEDLLVYGGVFKISPDDSEGIYTVVFMNGGLKKMRHVFEKIRDDSILHAMLEYRTPFIQNNVLRNFENAEFIGTVNKEGECIDGGGRIVRFRKTAKPRPLASDNKTILIAPNSFKGTISADDASRRLMSAIRRKLPQVSCIPVPAADGGDGTLSAIEKAVLGQRHGMEVTAPYGGKIKAEYYVVDGTKAIIESALASGIALCEGLKLDPLIATSRGTGELMLRAAHEGLRNIYVCLGGSATNDCGIGLASALGVKFLDEEGGEITEASGLSRIVKIDASEMDEQIAQSHIIAMCDVKNPLTGKNGATYTYGPQKGADEGSLSLLENGMLNMEKLLNEYAGRSVCSEEGAGAAGGMGAMLMALLGAEFMPGAEAILDIAEFDLKLKKADLVITGEGRIDATSLEGKAVGAVISRSRAAGVPAAVIAGSKGEGAEEVEALAVFTEYCDNGGDCFERFDNAADALAKRISGLFR